MKDAMMRNLCFAVLLGTTLIACASGPMSETEFEQARVIVPRTNPPEAVGGASVLVRYRASFAGPVGGHPSNICSRAWLAQTDAQGWFRYPKPQGKFEASFTAYKSGYRMPGLADKHAVTKGKEVYLMPWEKDATQARRVDMFRRYNGDIGCAQIGDNGQPIADFVKLLLPELREIAADEESKALIRNFEFGLKYRDKSGQSMEGKQR